MVKAIIDQDVVKKIADLAKLNLSEREIDIFTPQLAQILEYVSQLSSVDTQNVAPLSTVNGLTNISREDTTKPSLSQEEALSSSSSTKDNLFLTKATINND
jgi:aspartyl-tRNA(Asn)/glutamyl-tRNA(Gln) amidotransferase subunit C